MPKVPPSRLVKSRTSKDPNISSLPVIPRLKLPEMIITKPSIKKFSIGSKTIIEISIAAISTNFNSPVLLIAFKKLFNIFINLIHYEAFESKMQSSN